jgi:cell division protein FtsW (lipid II flippase)
MLPIPIYHPPTNNVDILYDLLPIALGIIGIVIFIYQSIVIIKKTHKNDYTNIKRPIVFYIIGVLLMLGSTYKVTYHDHSFHHGDDSHFTTSP